MSSSKKSTKTEPKSAKPAKDTLYIDADDEITMVIDRVMSASGKVVAVVLPKRATVFQSAVNMKLLKKAADDAKKNLVLITSEQSIKSIAAIAAVHVATSLSSKPEIPKKPSTKKSETTIAADELESAVETDEPHTDHGIIVSDNSGAESVGAEDLEETIKLDNTDPESPDSSTESDDSSDETPKSKRKKIKIPDFTSFQMKIGLAAAVLVLLVIGWVFGFVVLPKATIIINTDTSKVDVTAEFNAVAGAETSDFTQNQLRAVRVQTEKVDSVTVPATGEKDIGSRATGFVTLTNCLQSASGVTVPAGTGFSSGSLTYVTTAAVELGPAVYVGNTCISGDLPAFGAVKDADVQANSSGEQFNIASQALSSNISGVSAFGSAMSGGTTEIAKVVSAEDLQTAETQLAGSATSAALQELQGNLIAQELLPLDSTLEESASNTTRSAEVDSPAEELTLSRTVTFSMIGVPAADVEQLLQALVATEVGETGKNIRDTGVASAVYSLAAKPADTTYTIGIKAVATVGPEFDEATIKADVAGKERGDIESMLESIDGVNAVDVEFSPFWIFQAPSNADKVTITINEQE